MNRNEMLGAIIAKLLEITPEEVFVLHDVIYGVDGDDGDTCAETTLLIMNRLMAVDDQELMKWHKVITAD
jgi:hypothetical protein